MGLQDHFTLLARAPGAAGDLGIELGKTLRRAEIGGKQRAVDIQQRHQGDVREMMSLSQHLGANQNARAAAMDVGKILLQRSFTAGGIAVDT